MEDISRSKQPCISSLDRSSSNALTFRSWSFVQDYEPQNIKTRKPAVFLCIGLHKVIVVMEIQLQ